MDLLLAANGSLAAEIPDHCQIHFVVVLCENAGEVQRFPVSFGVHGERLPPVNSGPAAGTADLLADPAISGKYMHMMA